MKLIRLTTRPQYECPESRLVNRSFWIGIETIELVKKDLLSLVSIGGSDMTEIVKDL